MADTPQVQNQQPQDQLNGFDPNAAFQTETTEGLTQTPPSQPQAGGGDKLNGFDPNASFTEVKPEDQTQKQPEKAGFTSRFLEQSGIQPIGHLISSDFHYRVDAYHKMVDAFKSGDHETAGKYAAAILGNNAGGPHGEKDPIYEAARSIIMTPIEEVKAARKSEMDSRQDAAQGDYWGGVLDRTKTIQHLATAIPLVGPAARNFSDTIVQDVRDRNWLAAMGDATGVLSTLLIGKGLGEASSEGTLSAERAGSAIKSGAQETLAGIRPTTKTIAGEEVPVSSPQLQSQSMASRILTKLGARKDAAQKFIDTHVAPAAVRATNSNFANSALKTADDLRSFRGEPMASQEGMVLNSADDVSNMLKREAQTSYKKFDEGSRQDLKQYKDELEKWNEENEGREPKDHTPLPKKPRTFEELQGDRARALDVLEGEPTADEARQAKSDLKRTESQIDAFAKKHEDLVSRQEYDAANKARYQASQYKYIANKMRVAVDTGTEGATLADLKEQPLSFSLQRLKNLKNYQFDNTFGAGSFDRLLGPDGVKNYNDVLNVLENPINNNTLPEYLRHTGAIVSGMGGFLLGKGSLESHGIGTMAGVAGSLLTDHVINKLLFDPEFGKGMLTAYKNAAKMGSNLWKNKPDFHELMTSETGELGPPGSVDPMDKLNQEREFRIRAISGQGPKEMPANLERLWQEGAFGQQGETRIDTDAYAKAMAQARQELGTKASVEDVIRRRDQILGKKSVVGQKGNELTREETNQTRAKTRTPEENQETQAWNQARKELGESANSDDIAHRVEQILGRPTRFSMPAKSNKLKDILQGTKSTLGG